MEKIEVLQKMINESKNIVVLTGAGISTDSGLKDFRSEDGIYSTVDKKINSLPEIALSASFLYNHTNDFYEFYKKHMNCLNIEPNISHKYLKYLEDIGKLKAIVTQNIDGLHSKAGNKNVYEIHGTVYKNYCIKCEKKYDADFVFNSNDIPKCICGGIIRPDIVLYGEMLPERAYNQSLLEIHNADMLIVIGTSLSVHPAAGMIDIFDGKYLVIINKQQTPYDKKANLVINDSLKNVFNKLKLS